MDIAVGQHLGNYQLLKLLGQGGFAQVFLAEHRYLGTQAAIKILRQNQHTHKNTLHEARIIARLSHPHIVPVIELDIIEDTLFLVMEYIPGGTLRQLHPRATRLPLSIVFSYVQQIASALHYTHTQGITHGDVKPENILVGKQGNLLLSDFGMASMVNQQQHHNILGTVEYMSPEQLERVIHPAGDQYALAIMIYEWLSGHLPFTGSYVEVATQHALEPVPNLLELIPELPSDVNDVLHIALAKDANRRFASIDVFAKALERAATGTVSNIITSSTSSFPTSPSPQQTPSAISLTTNTTLPPTQAHLTTPAPTQTSLPPTQQAPYPTPIHQPNQGTLSRRMLITSIVGASTIGVMGAGTLFWLQNRNQNTPPTTENVKHNTPVAGIQPGTRLLTYQGPKIPLHKTLWSPDGKYLTAIIGKQREVNDADVIYIWEANTGKEVTSYRGHEGYVNDIAWSKNSKYIVSCGKGRQSTHAWESETGKTVTISNISNVIFVSWFNQTTIHMWLSNGEQYFHDIFSGPDAITSAPENQDNIIHVSLEAFRLIRQIDNSKITICQINDYHYTEMVTLNIALSANPLFSWSHNTFYVAMTTHNDGISVYRQRDWKLIGSFKQDKDVSIIAWSADDTYVACYGETKKVIIWEAQTGKVRLEYTPQNTDITSMTWSPNNLYIVCATRKGMIEIFRAL